MIWNKERIKSILLIFLIITCLVQIGILWNYQDQRLPISFIQELFSDSKRYVVESTIQQHKYLSPSRIIVTESKGDEEDNSDQEDKSKEKVNSINYLIPSKHREFERIWNDVSQNYFPKLFAIRSNDMLPKEQWETIIKKSCVKIEFENPINAAAVRWLTTQSTVKGDYEFEYIYKIAILPNESTDTRINTIYIYDGKSIFKYNMEIKSEAMRKEDYIRLITSAKESNSYESYGTIGEFFEPIPAIRDILIGIRKSVYINAIRATIPDEVRAEISNTETLQDTLIKGVERNYIPVDDKINDAIVFSKTDSLYRVYKNGVVEYKYLGKTTDSLKGKLEDALNAAIIFIDYRKSLLKNIGLSLVNVEEEKDRYRFIFEYRYNDLPIFILDDRDEVFNAVIIETNKEGVLSVWWVVRNFELSAYGDNYSIDFNEAYSNALKVFNRDLVINKLKKENDYIKYFEPNYVLNLKDEKHVMISPRWVIKTKLNKNYIIGMQEKEE